MRLRMLSFALCALVSSPTMLAHGQVNKGVLAFDPDTDTGYLRLRGDLDATMVFLGRADTSGNDLHRGKLLLYDGTASPEARVTLSATGGRGVLQLDDDLNRMRVDLRSSLASYGGGGNVSFGRLLLFSGSSGAENVYLGAGTTSDPDRGVLRLRLNGSNRVRLGVNSTSGHGELSLYNDDASIESVRLDTVTSTGGEGGRLLLRGPSNVTRVGAFATFDCGELRVHSNSGEELTMNACSMEKTAIMNHPTRPDVQVYYAALEGPEVGLYVRGTASLVRGAARIQLPEHFAVLASAQALSAQLTPRSANSLGLAVVALRPDLLEVVELGRGQGSYDFDYVIQGQRAGHEGYQALRPRARPTPGEAAVPANEATTEDLTTDTGSIPRDEGRR